MGGGGSGSGMQTSGGMTVYNNLGYDPSQPQGGYNWGAMLSDASKGMGKGISSGQTPVPNSQPPQFGDMPIQQQQSQFTPIQQNNLMDILLRLLGGQ